MGIVLNTHEYVYYGVCITNEIALQEKKIHMHTILLTLFVKINVWDLFVNMSENCILTYLHFHTITMCDIHILRTMYILSYAII